MSDPLAIYVWFIAYSLFMQMPKTVFVRSKNTFNVKIDGKLDNKQCIQR